MLKRSQRPWARLFVLLPFLVSTLIPVGMMPAVSGEGHITLIICTAHGLEERSVPAPVDHDGPDGVSSWCPFSLLSAPALPSAQAYPARGRTAGTVALFPADHQAPARLDHGSPQPRGPPTIL